MKIPSNLFDEIQVNAIKKQGIEIDFEKDYTDDEIVDIEQKLEDCMLDNGFTNCEPNEKCSFWEKIFDDFQDAMDS